MSTYKAKTNKEILSNAKGQLIGKYSIAIFAAVTVSFIAFIITSISDSTASGTLGSYLLRVAISYVIDLLMGILIYGRSLFFLNLVRGKEPLSATDVFAGFKHNIDKAVLVQGVFTLANIIGSLPAIIINLVFVDLPDKTFYTLAISIYAFNFLCLFVAKLFFGLSFYILCDRPNLSFMEVYKESIRLMKNKKGRYFLLCLRMLPIMIISLFAFFVGVFWYVAYFQTAIANFYLNAIEEEPANPFTKEQESHKETNSTDDYSI